MNWQEKLEKFEGNKDWDSAIEFMRKTIINESDNLEAYLSIEYLLMNLLVEEDYDINKHDYYAHLLKEYFSNSYFKFSTNSEYLFYTGIIAHMSEWYFEIDIEVAKLMIAQAQNFDPENILYKWGYYTYMDTSNINDREKSLIYSSQILADNSLVKLIKLKGALGRYILDIMQHLNIEK